jgi:ferredoxin
MPAGQKRLHVDARLCEGHALCIEIAPDIFALPDDDVATCVEHPADEQWHAAQAAIDACPRGAISIADA